MFPIERMDDQRGATAVRRRVRCAALMALAPFLLALLMARGAQAQIEQLLNLGGGQPPPPGVERYGLIEITELKLDGQSAFNIASPAVLDRRAPGALIPVEARARQIEASFDQAIRDDPSRAPGDTRPYTTLFDPKSAQVIIETQNSQPVLLIKDRYQTEPKALLTVTDSDAHYYALSKDALAARWQKSLNVTLREALEAREPGKMHEWLWNGLYSLISLIALTLIVAILWRFVGLKRQTLRTRLDSQKAEEKAKTAEEGEESPTAERRFIAANLGLAQQIQALIFIRWLLFWGMLFTWIIVASVVLYSLPTMHRAALTLLATPLLILIAWFVVGLVNWTTNFGLDQFGKIWIKNIFADSPSAARQSLRIPTIVSVAKGLKATLLYLIGIFWVLHQLEIVASSVIAFAAVAALALSFAAQSLVKDVVTGFLILAEDQFALGDYITSGAASGTVENMNLRITQIRSDEGRLITVPNSLIAQVENHTRGWSRVNLTLDFSADTDADKAMALVREVTENLAHEPEWRKHILIPVEQLGVDKFSPAGLTLGLWVRTVPNKHFAVASELRLRLKNALDHESVTLHAVSDPAS